MDTAFVQLKWGSHVFGSTVRWHISWWPAKAKIKESSTQKWPVKAKFKKEVLKRFLKVVLKRLKKSCAIYLGFSFGTVIRG